MKYIEELNPGDCFTFDSSLFILTSDFKKNGQKLSYSLCSGQPRWMNSQDIVESTSIYTLDENNNISPVQITHSQANI
jgi:hypothetical protein